ncbi:hypothetical protein E4U55_002989 [Claviceps digitariae]|nr:hypothetical protein E4U55_002989 [Claviceps digitariae]
MRGQEEAGDRRQEVEAGKWRRRIRLKRGQKPKKTWQPGSRGHPGHIHSARCEARLSALGAAPASKVLGPTRQTKVDVNKSRLFDKEAWTAAYQGQRILDLYIAAALDDKDIWSK